MNIFIDESGSFVNAPDVGAFNTIAAYMSPESDRRELRRILSSLKREIGVSALSEIKLKNISERQFFDFLNDLSSLSSVLYAVATDSGLNQLGVVAQHQTEQAAKIIEHIDKAIHQTARDGIQALSNRVASLSPQLYVQLQCQVELIDAIIKNGILYFVQRTPRSLGSFRWRVDQKNSSKTEYETAFQQLLPALLQSMSLQNPMPMLLGADYSAFSRFDWALEEKPTYLRDAYGLEINDEEMVTNIGMLVRENIEFVDSQANQGIQVADILASGLRRCLRCGFSDNDTAAMLLGRLMVQNQNGMPPIRLLGLLESAQNIGENSSRVVRIMKKNARPMFERQISASR